MQPTDRRPFHDELLTPAQVSQLLKVPVSTLSAWRSTGRVSLPYSKVGHAVRYWRSDVERLVVVQGDRP